jgi:hypothetical protein
MMMGTSMMDDIMDVDEGIWHGGEGLEAAFDRVVHADFFNSNIY